MHVPAVEEGGRRRQARLLVAARADAAVLEPCRPRLAEVVAEGAEHHRELAGPVVAEVAEERRRLVHDLQRVSPHVPLGVPARVLRRRLEGQELGRDDRQHPPGLQEVEAERRPSRLQQQLLDLAEDALGGQLGERHGGAEGGGRLVDRRARSARRTGRRAGRAAGPRRRCARPPRAGPGPSRSRRPPQWSRSSPVAGSKQHRVDREVAAARGFLDGEIGVALHGDPAVAGADLRVAARQGHVERSRDALDPGQLVDAERLPHRVHPAVASPGSARGAPGAGQNTSTS